MPLTAISFKDDGVTLAVGSVGGRVLIYDLRKGSEPVLDYQASTSIEPIDFLCFSVSSKLKLAIDS